MFNNNTAEAKNNARKAAKNAKDDVIEAAYEMKGDFRDTAHEAGEKVRHLYEGANRDFRQMRDSVTDRINEKPIQSAAIALVAGLAIGAILRRI
jgi:ElaB/YqjD/DUF883 family membrane-anchored ribosome-binding protein